MRPDNDVIRLNSSTLGGDVNELPSVITSVDSAAVNKDISSMQVDRFVGSHREDIGIQVTNMISIIHQRN